MVPLTGKQKSHLRSLAHKLKAVVQVGHQGATDGVVAAVEVALERHELIKVKVLAEAHLDPEALAPQLEQATRCQVAQIIGHTLVLYRRHPDKPKIVLPRVQSARERAALGHAQARPSRAEAEDDDGQDDGDDDRDLE